MVKVSYRPEALSPHAHAHLGRDGSSRAPATRPNYGRKLLAEDPHCPGSLGIAISEAIEDTVKHPDTKYSLGSVLNHVCLHQTVIGRNPSSKWRWRARSRT